MTRHEDDAPNYEQAEAFVAAHAKNAIRRLAKSRPEFAAEVLREMGYEVTPPNA